MLGKTFAVIMLLSFVTSMVNGTTEKLSFELIEALPEGVNLCISILGMMCFWCGIMRVLAHAGALDGMARLLKKPIRFIYGSKRLTDTDLQNISASFAADFLGLGNAALPFGIAAMKSLNKDNRDSASHEAIMHAVINTVPIQLVPATLIALRQQHGSINPFDVVPYIWLCSVIVTVFAIAVCKLFRAFSEKRRKYDI